MTEFFSCRWIVVGLVILFLASGVEGEGPAATAPPATTPSDIGDTPSGDLISLELWLISVRTPEKDGSNEQNQQAMTRLNSLKTDLGRRENVASLIAQLDEVRGIVKREKFRVATVADREAAVATGWRKPRVTATSVTQMGTSNAIVIEPLGTILHITPHVESDGMLLVRVKLETSMFLLSNDVPILVPNKGESTFAQTASSFQLDTAVRLKSGEASLVSATPSHDVSESAVQLIIVSASIDPGVEAPAAK